jgi:hypothetical protein
MAIIKVCDNDTFRNDLAITLVEEASPGYCGGLHYTDPLKGKIYYKEQNAAWNPWPNNVLVTPVYQLFENQKSNYSDQVDWNLIEDLPWEKMTKAYVEEYEPNSFQKSDVVAFARNYSEEWEKLISFEEENSREEAISFAKSEILDEIEID